MACSIDSDQPAIFSSLAPGAYVRAVLCFVTRHMLGEPRYHQPANLHGSYVRCP